MWTTILLLSSVPVASPVPYGLYVEARTAAVYAGACHFGSQYTTQGRAALLGWHFAGGSYAGVDLTGVDVAVALAADVNLDEADAKRKSVVYLDADARPAQRRAALFWLEREHGELLGDRPTVKRLAVDVRLADDAYRVTVGDEIELRGQGLPDRRCCTMPLDRWYAPFVRVEDSIVGCADEFRFADATLERRWRRAGENNTYFGSFGAPRTGADV